MATWQRLQDSKQVGELSRSALAAASRGEIRSGDIAVGMHGLKRKPPSDLLPGQRSLLAAIEGAQCDADGSDTQQHQRADIRL
ncbi:MAG: hypothetical protein IPG64_21235 [Haliea sp.]|nr:hypothetical protein [Haliea sp.]